jgi:hypothetical protein
MGKDYKQKIEAKCRQGLKNWRDAPINLKRKWNRHNWDIGEFKALKLYKREKEAAKIMNEELNRD